MNPLLVLLLIAPLAQGTLLGSGIMLMVHVHIFAKIVRKIRARFNGPDKELDVLKPTEIEEIDTRVVPRKTALRYTTLNIKTEKYAMKKYNHLASWTSNFDWAVQERWQRLQGEMIILNSSEAAVAKALFDLDSKKKCNLTDPKACQDTATLLFIKIIDRIDKIHGLQKQYKSYEPSPEWNSHLVQTTNYLNPFKATLPHAQITKWENILALPYN